jgi:hypothetical protein
MRLRRLRRNSWAAWLGVAALVVNALVPVHLAFDLADTLAPASHPPVAAGGYDLQWQVIAALTGHLAHAQHDHDRDHDHDRHHQPDCPVCSALGALDGLAPSAPPELSALPPVTAAPDPAPAAEWCDHGPVAAYRSRAPPAA